MAIATAPGRGAVGMVRVSGPDLKGLARAFFSVRAGDALSQEGSVHDGAAASGSGANEGGEAPAFPLRPRHAHYLPFLAANGEVIDHGLALYFPGPNSYTGEDVLELQGHGGPVVLKLLLDRLLELGAQLSKDDARFRMRLARPGEFTERAFLNEKLDLAQAEAVADLIDASTAQAARLASRSMEGVFSREIEKLVDQLIDLRMLVEATLDFPEEEIDFLKASNALGRLHDIAAQLETVLAQAKQGRLLRDGLKVVLVGEPNVGKSSLLNALAGEEVAIVTPIAGTTRDRIVQAIQIEGVPVTVVDTAGLRDTQDEVERMGIARTWAEVEKADVVLHLQDAREVALSHQASELSAEILEKLPPGVPRLVLMNKCDLLAGVLPDNTEGQIWLSAKGGQGIAALRQRLLEIAGWQPAGESGFIARERHLIALRGAREHVQLAQTHAEHNADHLELFAEELRLAQNLLSEITGEFTPDDLLGVIFSRFCIGK